MTERIQHFLLVFDHGAGELISTAEFGGDAERAVVAYAAAEAEFGGRERVEVVLIGSDSLETVKRTHANYFDGSESESKYLTGI